MIFSNSVDLKLLNFGIEKWCDYCSCNLPPKNGLFSAEFGSKRRFLLIFFIMIAGDGILKVEMVPVIGALKWDK